MGHRLQQFLPFGRIIDLGEFLRQIQVIPANGAILDEPFAGFGHLLVFLLRCRNSRGLPTETARVKAWTCSMPLSTFSMDMRKHRFVDHSQNEDAF
jgi:hypothetical protein